MTLLARIALLVLLGYGAACMVERDAAMAPKFAGAAP